MLGSVLDAINLAKWPQSTSVHFVFNMPLLLNCTCEQTYSKKLFKLFLVKNYFLHCGLKTFVIARFSVLNRILVSGAWMKIGVLIASIPKWDVNPIQVTPRPLLPPGVPDWAFICSFTRYASEWREALWKCFTQGHNTMTLASTYRPRPLDQESNMQANK